MMVAFGDRAFKRDDDDNMGHAMKGAAFMLVGAGSGDLQSGPTQLLEYFSRKQRHVCRSTYAAELFGLTETADLCLHMSSALFELAHGPQSTDVLRKIREGALQPPVPLMVITDADSVFRSVTSQQVKAPAEKSLLIHLQWLREFLDRKTLSCIAWCDTRSMVADALTKGSVDRTLLQGVMQGHLEIAHAVKHWRSSVALAAPKSKGADT